MNWKMWVPLALALGFGLLAAKIGRDIVVRQRGSAGGTKLARIVVVRCDLAAGTALKQEDVGTALVAADNVPKTALRGIADAIGRVAVVPMVRDQPVLDSLLAPAGAPAGPQALVPPGMRAVNVEVNEVTGLSGLLTSGCRVDVVATLQDELQKRAVARTIAQDVQVMWVGAYAPRTRGQDAPAKTVTLIVAPQQAEAIELAHHLSGRARLVLRSGVDREAVQSSGTTTGQLLGETPELRLDFLSALFAPRPAPVKAAAEAPKPLTPHKRTVEVIAGSELTKVELEEQQ